MSVPINENLGLKKSFKIVRGFQTDVAKSNVSVFSYNNAVLECVVTRL